MSLFESQEGRTKRLLQQALQRALERVEMYSRFDSEWKRVNARTHSAWLIGGFIAASSAVSQAVALKEAWGKGDASKAHALIEVFTLPMVSRWCWMVDRQANLLPERRKLARDVVAWNLLDLFGHPTDKALVEFMDMDAQFNHDCERRLNESNSLPYECVLVLGKAIEACSGSPAFRWRQRSLPVNNIEVLADALTEIPPFVGDLFGLLTISLALNGAFEDMVSYYNSTSAA